MFLTLISIVALFGLFVTLAVTALRHGADSRTESRGSLIAGDRTAPTGWFWR